MPTPRDYQWRSADVLLPARRNVPEGEVLVITPRHPKIRPGKQARSRTLQAFLASCLALGPQFLQVCLGLSEDPLGLSSCCTTLRYCVPIVYSGSLRPIKSPRFLKGRILAEEVHPFPFCVVPWITGVESEVEPLKFSATNRFLDSAVEEIPMASEVSQEVPLATVAVSDPAHWTRPSLVRLSLRARF